jgi:hypothetical protein
MNQRTGLVVTIFTIVLCGLPGIITGLGGVFIAGLGFLADKDQLKLDTNLDQTSIILSGMGGVCLGVILVAIPILLWLWTKRQKPD